MNIYLFIYLILFAITIYVLNVKQKKVVYLKIGWFFSLLTFAYYGFPILYIELFPKLAVSTLNRTFSSDFTKDLSAVMLIGQLGFLLSELFIKDLKIKTDFLKRTHPLNQTFLLILVALLFLSFFYKWSSVGGFMSIIQMKRFEYMNEAADSSNVLGRFDILFYIITSCILYGYFKIPNYFRKNKLVVSLYGLFLVMTLMMATRLLLLTAIVGIFSLLYIHKKSFILKNRFKISAISLVLILFFAAFKTIYPQLLSFYSGGNFSINFDEVSFLPGELFTSVLSHHSIENGVAINDINYLKKITPNRILTLFGYEPVQSFTQMIAEYSFYSSGRSVFTVPYLTDLYFSSNQFLLLFLITNIIVYVSFVRFQKILVRKNSLYLILLYVLIYYTFRAEASVWFGRLYLSFILMFLVIKVNDFLYGINKKHFYKSVN